MSERSTHWRRLFVPRPESKAHDGLGSAFKKVPMPGRPAPTSKAGRIATAMRAGATRAEAEAAYAVSKKAAVRKMRRTNRKPPPSRVGLR